MADSISWDFDLSMTQRLWIAKYAGMSARHTDEVSRTPWASLPRLDRFRLRQVDWRFAVNVA